MLLGGKWGGELMGVSCVGLGWNIRDEGKRDNIFAFGVNVWGGVKGEYHLRFWSENGGGG